MRREAEANIVDSANLEESTDLVGKHSIKLSVVPYSYAYRIGSSFPG